MARSVETIDNSSYGLALGSYPDPVESTKPVLVRLLEAVDDFEAAATSAVPERSFSDWAQGHGGKVTTHVEADGTSFNIITFPDGVIDRQQPVEAHEDRVTELAVDDGRIAVFGLSQAV